MCIRDSPKTGMAPGVMGLTAEDMQNFYSQLPKRLESVIDVYKRQAQCSMRPKM